jgi:hypothetical protein
LYTVTEYCAGGNLAHLLAQSVYNKTAAASAGSKAAAAAAALAQSAAMAGVAEKPLLVWSPQLMSAIVQGLLAAVRTWERILHQRSRSGG